MYGAMAYLVFVGYFLLAFLYTSWNSHYSHDSLVLLAMGRRWQGYELRASHLRNRHLRRSHYSPGCGPGRSFLGGILAMALPAKEHGQRSRGYEQASTKVGEDGHGDT